MMIKETEKPMVITLSKVKPYGNTSITLLCDNCHKMNSETETYAIIIRPFRYICQKCACTESEGKTYQIMEKMELPQ